MRPMEFLLFYLILAITSKKFYISMVFKHFYASNGILFVLYNGFLYFTITIYALIQSSLSTEYWILISSNIWKSKFFCFINLNILVLFDWDDTEKFWEHTEKLTHHNYMPNLFRKNWFIQNWVDDQKHKFESGFYQKFYQKHLSSTQSPKDKKFFLH